MRTTTTALLIALAVNSLRVDADEGSAREILDHAIKATGGAGTFGRLKGPMMWMERGTFHGMDDAIPYVGQYATKWPDWYRQEIEGVFTITASGDRAWLETAAGVRKLADQQLDELRQQVRISWAERLFPLTDDSYTLSVIDPIDVDGRATVGIKASHAEHRDLHFYFDAKSYQVVKMTTRVVSPQHGPEPVSSEAYFFDHKSFSGVRMPSAFKLYYAGELFVEARIVDYKMGATLDPEHFKEPE